MSPSLVIKKCSLVLGNRLRYRNASEEDAAFILSLRTHDQLSRYLSPTPPDSARQLEWLRNYNASKEQAYFVIETIHGVPLGTVRFYDARGASFGCGSWILRPGSPHYCAIESAMIGYRYMLGLGFTCAHFRVSRENRTVWRFHERFGAIRAGEDADAFHYTIDHAAILESLRRYTHFLPEPIEVVP